ncbi:MAG: S-layer homology domain-containing protein [Acidimicrobiia bacterium]|jgi:hypothetical protein
MRKSTLVTLLVVGALLVPAAVYASHQFTDVPNSHTFHNAIGWLKDHNITVGCNPPANTQYCPDDNVTRGQMAAFMKRLAENNVVDAATLDGRDSAEYLAVTTAQSFDFFDGTGNIALPAAGTPIVETAINAAVSGHLLVSGQASVGNSANLGSFFTVWLELDDGACGITSVTPNNSAPGGTTYASPSFAGDDFSTAVSSVVPVAAGPHTVTLCGANTSGSGASFNATVVAQFLGEGSSTGLAGVSSTGGDGGPNG